MTWPALAADPFEIVEEDVLGERMEVFAHRPHDLRELLCSTTRFDDQEYLIIDGRRLAYRQVRELVAALAAGLAEEYGIGAGDRVAILGENRVEWLLTFWAVCCLGAVSVGLNGWWASDELAHYLADADPKAVVVSDRMSDRLGPPPPRGRRHIPRIAMSTIWEQLIPAHEGSSLPDGPIAEDDPVVILYTSGTTGRSKGAINSHRNAIGMVMLQTSAMVRRALADPSTPRDIACTMYPFFHVSGLYGSLLVPTIRGDASVFVTGKFDAPAVLRAIEAERCTKVAIVPTTATRLVHELESHPGQYDVSSLTRITGGGAPFTPSLIARMKRAFPGALLAFGYGLTENAGLVTGIAGADLDQNPQAAGRVYPTMKVEIRDPSGHRVPDGVQGQVHIRGPLVMPGYWRNERATREAMAPGRWLRTGDLGTMTDGMLELTGRRSDLIIRGGENVYPAEIEAAIDAHPEVAECAVVGVPHPDLGQEVAAHVVLHPGSRLSEEQLRAWLAPTLAYFKVPSRWVISTTALPRTASGKLRRNELPGLS